MRYFLRLSYDGSAYHGWQRQPNAMSVQQVIEESLQTVLRRPVAITGAGRTDTGVNARVMYAHFDVESPISDRSRLLTSLNRLCGRSVSIHDILDVRDDAHARFDASLRSYKYFVINQESPFNNRFSWYCPAMLDITMMNKACEILCATSDFTSFAKLHSDAKTNICNVSEASWTPYRYNTGERGWVFTISADRFLRNMVRAIVGTLVEVGRGKLDINGFIRVIEQKDRCAAGTSMPASPLFLWDVKYPEDIFIK
ncbi:MAG: tRNA pseudouridine(38-40) synthase TruA [Muribaculaceae bacterium]|nr:tRNA pseudouridine(38-40) synthase TruA [Muribaculaceae bacterium]